MSLCYCGSGQSFEACCKPYIDGQAQAPTAETLMRSRYSAHCVGNFDYLDVTVHPDLRDEGDHAEMQRWSEAVTWEGLTIMSSKEGGENDDVGEVAFTAHYSMKGVPQTFSEDAFFRKQDGKWYYVDGNVHGQTPVRRQEPKVGRNDPCPCGSGKKYKKCCQGKA